MFLRMFKNLVSSLGYALSKDTHLCKYSVGNTAPAHGFSQIAEYSREDTRVTGKNFKSSYVFIGSHAAI